MLSENPKATGGGDTSGGSLKVPPQEPPTIADMGIDKKLSAHSQKIAKIEDDDFEVIIESAREKVTTKKGLR